MASMCGSGCFAEVSRAAQHRISARAAAADRGAAAARAGDGAKAESCRTGGPAAGPRDGGQGQHEVPSFFRRDRVTIQCACTVGLALSYSTANQVHLMQYLGTLYSTLPHEFPGGRQGLPAVVVSALPAWVAVVLVLAVVAAACWEATRFPRLACHRTPLCLLRTLLQFLGDLLLAPLRAILPGERPLLDYRLTEQNERILELCPSLRSFKQTAWLHNSLLSFAVLMWSDFAHGYRNRGNVRRECLAAADGGVVALDWWEPPGQVQASSTPRRILLVGSTFTGDALVSVTRELCEHFTALGWRCAVHVKRGCGLTMPNIQPRVNAAGDGPVKPWCLSGLEDLELAIDHIAATYPDAVLCGVGLSTGAGQLKNYVAARGRASRLAAAVVVDGAPAWRPAVETCDRELPLLSRILTAAARASFQNAFQPDVCAAEPGSFGGGFVDFVRDLQAPAFGFERSAAGVQKYFEACQPADISGCTVPLLQLLTYNDTLIAPHLHDVTRKEAERSPHTIVATTRQGTHVIRWEGLYPQCWLRRVSAEFLEAALQVSGAEAASCEPSQ